MPMKKPTIVFGVHQITPYNRLTGRPYGSAFVLASSSFAMSGESIDLFGGSLKSAWASEDGNDTTEISLAFRQLESWMYEIFQGATPVLTAASATGSVDGFVAKKGITAKSSTIGVASVAIKTGGNADLKFGKYIVVAASATTVDVYALTNVNFNRGNDLDYVDESLKITTTPLTITTATAVEVPGLGVELMGGSGTIAMVVGDTATFEVFPPHSGKMKVKLGGQLDVRPEFGMLMVAQKSSTGQMFDIDAFRCKANGLPIALEEKAFFESEVTLKALFDPELGGVADITLCTEA